MKCGFSRGLTFPGKTTANQLSPFHNCEQLYSKSWKDEQQTDNDPSLCGSLVRKCHGLYRSFLGISSGPPHALETYERTLPAAAASVVGEATMGPTGGAFLGLALSLGLGIKAWGLGLEGFRGGERRDFIPQAHRFRGLL